MVKVPEFGFKIIDDATNKKRYFYVSNKPRAGVCEKHPGSGKYVGRYNTISGNYSKSGAVHLVNITRPTARSGAKGKGSKWSEYDYAFWCAVWLLYLVEYADWDSQAKIGKGRTDGSSPLNSGGTDTMTYHTGRAAGTDGQTAVQYRHVENPWGNVYEWIDGINFNERAAFICLDHTKYADDTATNYTAAGITLPAEGWIKTLGQSPDFPWAFLPTGVGGSETTCIPDQLTFNAGWRVLLAGGIGLFFLYGFNASPHTAPSFGARLLFHP